MEATITGDIVKSRTVEKAAVWAEPLKQIITFSGIPATKWSIYRGDSFQIAIDIPSALRLAVLIKASIRKTDREKLDVRLAIGVGEEDNGENVVNESMGSAFIYSGELLDELKSKKVHLGIRSPWGEFDKEMNMMFRLALVIMNSWSANTAEVAELLFSVPGITQQQIADRLNIAQSSVNDRIKRGSVYEIIELEKYYNERVLQMPGVI